MLLCDCKLPLVFLFNKFMTLGKFLCFGFVSYKIMIEQNTYILSCYKDFKTLIDIICLLSF